MFLVFSCTLLNGLCRFGAEGRRDGRLTPARLETESGLIGMEAATDR